MNRIIKFNIYMSKISIYKLQLYYNQKLKTIKKFQKQFVFLIKFLNENKKSIIIIFSKILVFVFSKKIFFIIF